MQKFSLHKIKLGLILSILAAFTKANAQITVTINATGTTGSYKTGSVNSAGTKNDGLMIGITSSNNRGWAVFDLSSIPVGSTVNSVNLKFTTTSNTVTSSATNYIGGFGLTVSNDPSTVAGGTLYANLLANSTTNFNASSWTANSLQTKAINASGVSFISNNLGGSVVMSFVRGSTNSYEIYGYNAPSSAEQPQLEITYIPSTPCAGIPSAGTASGPLAACPSAPFNLTVSGFTAMGGITFQWESSPPNLNLWTPISGATSSTYSATQTTATDYHVIVTCTNGGGNATSNTVAVGMNSFLNCYCSSLIVNTGDEEILNVTLGTMNNSSTYGQLAPGPGSIANRYSNYTTSVPPPNIGLGQNIPFSVQIGQEFSGTYSNSFAIYIDYNRNGILTDAGEQVYLSPYLSGAYIQTGSITVPVGADTGLTLMRVINVEDAPTSITPCGTPNTWGEVEDYFVYIFSPNSCAGIPVAGTASGPAGVCSGNPFNLTLTGYTLASGITFQWQSSPASASIWTPILGATNANYTVSTQTTATDYRVIVTCINGGGNATSNTVSVGQNPVTQCYCTPVYTTGTTAGDYLSLVQLGLISNSTGPSSSPYYTYYNALSTNLAQGSVYTMTVSAGTYTSNDIAAWIDFNQDGIFDFTEKLGEVDNIPAGPATATITFTVPLSATLGTTRLRVREADQGTTGGMLPCNTETYGETEDYDVLITVPPLCISPLSPVPLNITSSAATIQWSQSPSSPQFGYEWRIFPSGQGPNGTPLSTGIEPAGDTVANISSLSPVTGYTFFVRAICSIADTSSWVNLNFTTPCATMVAPYSETFNSGSTPSCWTNTGPEFWLFSQGAGPAYGVAGSQDHTGNNGYFAWVDGSGSGNSLNILLTSPPIDISLLTNPRLRYYVISYDIDNPSGNNKLIVEGLNGSAWIQLDSVQMNFPSAAWQQRIIPLTGISSTITQFRFRVDEQGGIIPGFTAFYNDILIDDIFVESSPSCPFPVNLSVSGIGSANTTLSWQEIGSATQWRIEYGALGFVPGTGTFVTANTVPSFNLTGLTPNTSYSFYVRSICSSSDSSTQTGPFNFTTAQIPVSAFPYAQNWETGGADWTYRNGTQPNTWYVGTAAQYTGLNGLYITNDGGLTNGYNVSSTSVVQAYRDLNLSTFSSPVPITLAWRAFGESGFDWLRVWITPLSYVPNPGTQTSVANSGGVELTPSANGFNQQGTWQEASLTIPTSFTGMTVRLVLEWRNDGSVGTQPPAAVDALTIGGFPLDVKLATIAATNEGQKNRVDWTTLTEHDGDYFELERAEDGVIFSKLTSIDAKGMASTYSYWDNRPLNGINHYRLKMLDKSGNYSYSRAVTATLKATKGLIVEAYPNPVNDILSVNVYGNLGANATVSITDITGKVISVSSIESGKAEIKMSGLAQGVYLIKYNDSRETRTIKINKN